MATDELQVREVIRQLSRTPGFANLSPESRNRMIQRATQEKYGTPPKAEGILGQAVKAIGALIPQSGAEMMDVAKMPFRQLPMGKGGTVGPQTMGPFGAGLNMAGINKIGGVPLETAWGKTMEQRVVEPSLLATGLVPLAGAGLRGGINLLSGKNIENARRVMLDTISSGAKTAEETSGKIMDEASTAMGGELGGIKRSGFGKRVIHDILDRLKAQFHPSTHGQVGSPAKYVEDLKAQFPLEPDVPRTSFVLPEGAPSTSVVPSTRKLPLAGEKSARALEVAKEGSVPFAENLESPTQQVLISRGNKQFRHVGPAETVTKRPETVVGPMQPSELIPPPEYTGNQLQNDIKRLERMLYQSPDGGLLLGKLGPIIKEVLGASPMGQARAAYGTAANLAEGIAPLAKRGKLWSIATGRGNTSPSDIIGLQQAEAKVPGLNILEGLMKSGQAVNKAKTATTAARIASGLGGFGGIASLVAKMFGGK